MADRILPISDMPQFLVEHHCEDDWKEGAEYEFGFTWRQLRRLFGLSQGETPGAFMRRIRMEVAAGRLTCEGLSVWEAALEARYERPEAFAKAFEDHWGVCPTMFVSLHPDGFRTPSYQYIRAGRGKAPEAQLLIVVNGPDGGREDLIYKGFSLQGPKPARRPFAPDVRRDRAMSFTNFNTINGVILGESTGGVSKDYLTDGLGSVTGYCDSSGVVVNTYRHKPFGAQLSKSGSGPDPAFRWCGSSGYLPLGLSAASHYVRARVYDQAFGRWSTVDPTWPLQPPFSYAANNPSARTDPSGLDTVAVFCARYFATFECYSLKSGDLGISRHDFPIHSELHGHCDPPFRFWRTCQRDAIWHRSIHGPDYGWKKAIPTPEQANCPEPVDESDKLVECDQGLIRTYGLADDTMWFRAHFHLSVYYRIVQGGGNEL